MKRASKKQFSGTSRASLALAAAVGAAMATSATRAATVTWTGAVPDPASATYTATAQGTAAGFVSGQNIYLWNTSAANWSGAATYTPGDNVIFTDNFAGGTDIRLTNGTLNPTSITFSHIAGSTPVTYRFTHNGSGVADFQDSTPANLSANSPFGAGANTVLTLDTGFLGTVVLRQRSNSAVASGNTIVRSGILEISDGGALPHNGIQNQPTLTLDGGEFRVKVNTGGNTNPAGGQISGALTVLSNSTLSNGETTRTAVNQGATVWNGPVTMGAGITLTLKSYTDVRLNLQNMNISNVAGTILLADDDGVSYGSDGVANTTIVGVNNQTSHDATNALIDLGTGASEIWNTGGNLTYDWGALQGGANTKITGSGTAAGTGSFSIGSRGDSTTFAGILRDNPILTSALVGLTKVGTGTLTLTGASTHSGATIARAGTLLLSGANGSIVNSAVTIDSAGTFSVNNTTSNNNRLSDSLAVTMNQGNLIFQGNLGGSPTAENAGVLTLAGGSNVVQTTATGVGGPASLTFTNIARTAGVVDFQPAAGVNVAITGAALTNGIIGGYATANQNDWATISGGSVAAYAAYTNNTAPGTWAATENINLTTGGTSTVAASASINSLRFAGTGTTVSISAGQTLNTGLGILATGTGGATISGAGTLTAGTGAAEMIVTVPSVGNTLTISAPIADNGGGAVTLVKAGAGKLFLSGSGSTYTGGTQLIGGTLQVGVANFFPAGSNLTINYGTSFDIGGFNQTFNTVSLIDGSLLNSLGAASVSATTFDVRKGTISAAMGGAAVLNKTTGDTVTITGANTYTGGTNVTGGTLVAGAANTLPSGQNVTISGGATVNIGAFNQTVGVLTVGNSTTSAGNLIGTTGVVTPTSVDAQNGTISGIIGGTTGVTKLGVNTTVALLGLNTYTGPTVIQASGNSGTLLINNLANGGSPSSLGASGNSSANLTLGGGSTLSYNGTGGSTDRLWTQNGSIAIGSNGTGAISFTNTGAVGGGSLGVITLTGSNTGNNTFSPLLTASDIGGITKGGAGTWIVTNDNTYTGITTIGGGGTSTLQVAKLTNGGVASPLGAASNASTQLVLNNGTLKYTGSGHSTDRLFNLNNSSSLDASGTGVLSWTNTGAIGGPLTTQVLTFTGTSTANNNFSPVIGGTVPINKTGAGRWSLSAANTTTGAITVSAGTLAFTKNMTTSASVTVSGGTLEMTSDASENLKLSSAAVSVTGTGKIDVQDNKLITQSAIGSWNGSNYTGITGLVAAGRGDGSWNGDGIITSMSDATTSLRTGLAAMSGADARGLGPTDTDVFAGVTINGDSSIVMYTWGGDADLNGELTGDDYFFIDSNILAQVPGYHNGDFDYNGEINGDDYFIIDANFTFAQNSGHVFPTGSGGGGVGGLAAVPEPASIGGVALAAASLLSRRRRRSR